MIKGEYDNLEEIRKHNVCGICDLVLEVSWHSEEKCYVLRCGNGHYPDLLKREMTLTEHYKAGTPLPLALEQQCAKSLERRRIMQQNSPEKTGLILSHYVDLGSGQVLDLAARKALIAYADTYGLDYCRDHVVLMYGKPYITEDGYLYHAAKEKIPYSMTGCPLTEQELKQLGYTPDDLGYHVTIKRHDTQQVFDGFGFVAKTEREEMSAKKPTEHRYPIIASKPGIMVIKRAEWQALKRAFPIGESEQKEDG